MRLIQYLDNHGQFDYERYRIAQIKGNHQKIENTWVYKPTIKILSEYILANIEVPKAGICHGTRRGNEQKWFREYLGPKIDVIGTEISDTAAQFLYTIQHDFHERRSEWVSKFDFVYSNSWDHAYDPAKAFRVWVESLQPHGLLLLEHSMGHAQEYTSEMDPFGATFDELIEFLNEVGKGTFRVKDVIDKFDFSPPRMRAVKFVVVGFI